MTLKGQIEDLKQDVQNLQMALKNAEARVTATCVVMGLMADKYPGELIGKYIQECVDYELRSDLERKEVRAMAYLADTVGPETFEKLVKVCENGPLEDSDGSAFEMPGGRVEQPKKQRARGKTKAADSDGDAAAGTDPEARVHELYMAGRDPEVDPKGGAAGAKSEGKEKSMARDEP